MTREQVRARLRAINSHVPIPDDPTDYDALCDLVWPLVEAAEWKVKCTRSYFEGSVTDALMKALDAFAKTPSTDTGSVSSDTDAG